MDNLLFVYGTLRLEYAETFIRNEISQDSIFQLLTQNSDFLGDATFRGQLFDIGGYPGVIESSNPADIVLGEIYAIHPEKAGFVFKKLDYYEKCGPNFPQPAEYIRKQCAANCQGQSLFAWIYLYNYSASGLLRIKNGDYLNYLKTFDV